MNFFPLISTLSIPFLYPPEREKEAHFMYELYLPYPPTINSYYVKTRNGIFISTKGRKFRVDVAEAVVQQLPDVSITFKVLIEIVLYPPDKRKRDIDNCSKAILDSLTKCGLWDDDVLVDQLFIYRGAITRPLGNTFIRITNAGPIIPVHCTSF